LSSLVQRPGVSASRTIPFGGGVARVIESNELRECDAWREAFARQCKDHRFYEIIERTLDCGFEHHYLLLEESAGNVRAVQPVFFVQQNLVEGIPALRAAVDAVRWLFPRFLTMRILMVGCAAGDGHLGARSADDEQWTAAALHAVLKTYARSCGASLVVFKDIPARYRETLRLLSTNSYTRVPSMPMTRMRLRYRDFEEYLNSLSKATRKDLRRKFRKIEKASPIEREVVTDITPFVDDIYPLYLQVHERSPQKFERLTKDYFRALSEQMPERTRFFIWRFEGRIVAFSLCLVHNGTIYDDYLGLDYSVALELHLYFYTLRDIFSWAIEQRLEWYVSSPLNYNPKLHLGCELVPLDLYVMHTQPLLNPVFRRALKYLEPTRHDPVLQRFPNAHELL
jgi:predicted N-acyltransferase